MRLFKDSVVLVNQMEAEDIYRLEFPFPEISEIVAPGQFVNLYFPGRPQLFPRPFSVAGVRGENIVILYKNIGCLTAEMNRWQPGQAIRVLGPLGNCFTIQGEHHVILAGGVGLAPLLFLNSRLASLNQPCHLFIGARTVAQLPATNAITGEIFTATDDGSYGFHGNVVECFRQKLDTMSRPFSVYACGPDAMLAALWRMSLEQGFDLQLSLEKIMACGLGICQGCAIKHARENEHPLRLICQDGPVFNAKELDFNG